jgi:cell wall-associated NlpC family hydrolase
VARGVLVATLLGLTGAGVPGLASLYAPGASATGTSSSTTTPGAAPNQSQINATQSQVNAIAATLSQEEQESEVLDNSYDNAVQNLQNAQNALQAIETTLARTDAAVRVDKHHLTEDALKAYIYATPQTTFASLFSSSATLSNARDTYTQQIMGNLNQARNTLQSVETHLDKEKAQQQTVEAQSQSAANQAKSLAQANEAEAATTKATLSQVQGQLAQEVAQAEVEEAQQEAAAAAKAASAAQAQKEAAAAAAAATVAGAVGGSASGAAATTAANQAGSSAGGSAGGGAAGTSSGPVGGTGTGTAQQMAAVDAAISQLGVPYVYGGDSPSAGFDCSGLVQWSWGQAGVSIPRTTETQWPALQHVSLSALEPGDLLYYYNLDGDDAVDHVVMYVGSGPYGTDTVIQAPFTGSTVSYSPIFTEGLIGAARP